ncbi:MAG: HEAT repeat domain-containing protein [Planctomycetota bacterium]|nr:HEAT repeat domain-containing protein [Planctomycetota bacterium]
MSRGYLFLLLVAACSSAPRAAGESPAYSNPARRRSAVEFSGERPLVKATEAEQREFDKVWLLYRKGDRGWPAARDAFAAKNDACAYLISGHLIRHYYRISTHQVGIPMAAYPKQLRLIQAELVAIGEPCVPFLVNLMVLDEIPGGRRQEPYRPDDIMRRECIEVLGRIGTPAIQTLREAYARKDTTPKARRFVLTALGATRDRAVRPFIEDALKSDPSWEVRAGAAMALGHLGDRQAAASLREAAKSDADPGVRRRAAKALNRLAGLES